MSPETKPFWIDSDYDLTHASNGVSRYGSYLRQNINGFAECWDGTFEESLPVRFAAEAWRIATAPVMVPGYVRYHPRILWTHMDHSYWDGSLAASVELITPWPRALTDSSQWMQDTGNTCWHAWPEDHLSGQIYRAPTDQDISQHSYLMTRANLCFTLPDGQLPQPPSGDAAVCELADRARQAVAVLVAELNQVLTPVIQALEGSAQRSYT